MTLCSTDLQFGFKKGTSTTQFTFIMLETIDHYNFMKFNTFVLMFDESKPLIQSIIVRFLGSYWNVKCLLSF